MSAELVTGDVWGRLRKAHRKTRRQASVAVAYFGKGAAKLLSLKKGDQLVVDASENAVKSGQTYPEDLLTLLKKKECGYSASPIFTPRSMFLEIRRSLESTHVVSLTS